MRERSGREARIDSAVGVARKTLQLLPNTGPPGVPVSQVYRPRIPSRTRRAAGTMPIRKKDTVQVCLPAALLCSRLCLQDPMPQMEETLPAWCADEKIATLKEKKKKIAPCASSAHVELIKTPSSLRPCRTHDIGCAECAPAEWQHFGARTFVLWDVLRFSLLSDGYLDKEAALLSCLEVVGSRRA